MELTWGISEGILYADLDRVSDARAVSSMLG